MKLHILVARTAAVMLGVALAVCNPRAQTLGSVFQMMGGMDTVTKLASGVLQTSASDPRLAGVLGKADTGSMAPKLADQMCAMLGGSCKAPLTDQQIAAGSSKLDDAQKRALSENFSSALKSATSNPLVMEGVSKAIAPKLGGIVGGLL